MCFCTKFIRKIAVSKASAIESYLGYVDLILLIHCLGKQHPYNKIAHLRFIDAFCIWLCKI